MDTVNYRFTEADLVDARRHAYNTLPVVRLARLFPYAMIVFGVLLVGVAMPKGLATALSAGVIWFIAGFGLIAWTLLGDRWLLPRSVRKSLMHDKGLQGEIVMTWNTKEIRFQSDHGESRWPWSDLARWQDSPGGLLLWQSNRLYNYAPKRVLSSAQLADLREHLTSALGSQGKRRRPS